MMIFISPLYSDIYEVSSANQLALNAVKQSPWNSLTGVLHEGNVTTCFLPILSLLTITRARPSRRYGVTIQCCI